MSTELSTSTPRSDATDPPRDRVDVDVDVVGAGLAGLAAAAIVARAGHRVTVHERKRWPGGFAITDERGGYRFNQGPHALYRGGEAERVLRSVGVIPRGVAPALRGAQVMREGRLHLAPGGATSLLRTTALTAGDKARLARLLGGLAKLDSTRYASSTVADTIADLTDRPRVQQLLTALVRLTSYGNAPDAMSGDVAVQQLQGGLGPGVLYLHRGWQQLVDALAATPGVTVVEGDPVRSLDALDALVEGGIGAGGAPVIVAAGGPRVAADITGHRFAPGVPAMVASLDLALAAPPPTSFVLGLDEPMYLSDHGVADGMAPAGAGTVTLGLYAPSTAEDAHDPHADRDAMQRFAERSGIRVDDAIDVRYLHRMPAVTALPLAATGGLQGRPGVTVPNLDGVFVAGDWVGPRGHLADAVLASAAQAARAALRVLDQRATVR